GIAASGTMAHSYVQSFASEIEAFRACARAFPAASTLLVDTYDVETGLRHAVTVGREMADRGQRLSGVRIDSGDLDANSRLARQMLDAAGLRDVRIVVSGGLNEHKIADLVARGAPIDVFGVGTEMGVSGDAPSLDCAYKLVEYDGRPRFKLSQGKETLAGRKQVWRVAAGGGQPATDVIGLRDEPPAAIASQLAVDPSRLQLRLVPVMRGGRRINPPDSLEIIRARCRAEIDRVPEEVKRLRAAQPYAVALSTALQHQQRSRP